MSAPPGFDPNVSMLKGAGDSAPPPVIAMRGRSLPTNYVEGGYKDSLLPGGNTEIPAMRGGVITETNAQIGTRVTYSVGDKTKSGTIGEPPIKDGKVQVRPNDEELTVEKTLEEVSLEEKELATNSQFVNGSISIPSILNPGSRSSSTPPVTGSTTPVTGSTTPVTGSTTPVTGSTPPGNGAGNGSGNGSTPPGSGSTPPVTGSTPPVTGLTTPGNGSTTPGNGSTAPGSGSTAPGNGSTPPGNGSGTKPITATTTTTPTTPAVQQIEVDSTFGITLDEFQEAGGSTDQYVEFLTEYPNCLIVGATGSESAACSRDGTDFMAILKQILINRLEAYSRECKFFHTTSENEPFSYGTSAASSGSSAPAAATTKTVVTAATAATGTSTPTGTPATTGKPFTVGNASNQQKKIKKARAAAEAAIKAREKANKKRAEALQLGEEIGIKPGALTPEQAADKIRATTGGKKTSRKHLKRATTQTKRLLKRKSSTRRHR